MIHHYQNAIIHNKQDKFTKMFEEDYPFMDEQMVTDLFLLAVRVGNYDITKYLIDKGCHPNVKDKQGLTAVQIACYRRQPEMMELLLTKGGDFEVTLKNGDTPLHTVCRLKFDELKDILIAHGANYDRWKNKEGLTAKDLYEREPEHPHKGYF